MFTICFTVFITNDFTKKINKYIKWEKSETKENVFDYE